MRTGLLCALLALFAADLTAAPTLAAQDPDDCADCYSALEAGGGFSHRFYTGTGLPFEDYTGHSGWGPDDCFAWHLSCGIHFGEDQLAELSEVASQADGLGLLLTLQEHRVALSLDLAGGQVFVRRCSGEVMGAVFLSQETVLLLAQN